MLTLVHLKGAIMEFLDFKDISQKVSFENLLNWLNIPFNKNGKELKGDTFIVNIEKNVYINPKNKEERGSPINFLSHHRDCDLRSAASEIKKQFLTNKPKEEKTLPELELHYSDQLMTYDITDELAKDYKIGLVKQRSIMAGKIALKVYNADDSLEGYIGYTAKEGWYYPKGFKRPIWNLNRLKEAEFLFLTTNPFDALKIISLGFPHTTSLLGNSLTDEQFNQLNEHEFLQGIHLIHPDPMNIVTRIAKHMYIRYTIPPKSLRETSISDFHEIYLSKSPM